MRYATPQQITETCPTDHLPHNFLLVESRWVYCTKCTTTVELVFGSTPPDPEPPEPPTDAVVITPTGGDDTAHLQQAIASLPAGKVLMLSGIFKVNNSVYLESKAICNDPAKPSGMRSTNSGTMSGPYAAMLVLRGNGSRVAGLEFDGGGNPTELIFAQNVDDATVEACWLHDINASGGPPFGAIHSEGCAAFTVTGNNIERVIGPGVRGIWVRSNNAYVEHNRVYDSGHTGIAVEAVTGYVGHNTAEHIVRDGTGMKIVFRHSGHGKAAGSLRFANNVIVETANGGVMLEDCADAEVVIEDCQFIRCGAQGTHFGAVYSSSQDNNVIFRNNRVENCRSLGGISRSRNWQFLNTTFVGGSDCLYLEGDCHDIRLTSSGRAEVGPNCSNVWVDGVQVA